MLTKEVPVEPRKRKLDKSQFFRTWYYQGDYSVNPKQVKTAWHCGKKITLSTVAADGCFTGSYVENGQTVTVGGRVTQLVMDT